MLALTSPRSIVLFAMRIARACVIIFILLIPILLQAQAVRVMGQVSDSSNNPLPFASVIIKGTSQGTSANSQGFYSIDVAAGKYTIVVQHVGYKSIEKRIEVKREDVLVDYVLPQQQYDLGTVVVRNGEDQAYSIIRNAIKKRSAFENEHKRFTVSVYIKGLLQLRDYPKKLLGQKVDFEDGDTSKKKVIFLSETVARYSVDKPKSKVEVLSTRVSGQSDGFGFSNPQILSFYQNNISIPTINPRGFVSPIADNALNFYRYKFEGTFFENGKMINRVRVIPKRLYEPLFNGIINIVDDEWRIFSLQLSLFKENQIQFTDTLTIEQLYVPYKKSMIIKQQNIYPSVRFLGFDGFGSFIQIYDDYDDDPDFPKKFFDNTVLKFYDSSNKKQAAYWDSIRPIPLVDLEIEDYKKKDSLEVLRNDPAYLDSLDRIRNKINLSALILTGQTFTKEKQLSSITINSLLYSVNFNTVEGLVFDINGSYEKKWNRTKRNKLTISPELRYGFSNGHFNPNLTLRYDYGKNYATSVTVIGGKKVFQFDNRSPVRELSNTISTLYYNRNYLKIYEAYTGKISYSKGFGEGLTVSANLEYQDRQSLENTTTFQWRKVPGIDFTPNISIVRHQATVASVNLRWQPGARYIEYPDRKVLLRSKYPVFSASMTRGIKGLFSSDVDYLKWKAGVSQNLNLKLAGRLNYNIAAGGFLSDRSAFLPDFNHYISNRYAAAAPYLRSFQLMSYYQFSNTARLYGEQHLEYHLNGFLTNKIPGFKKLNWFLITGNNLLYINGGTLYGEVFMGLENVLKIGRIDFVQSFNQQGWHSSGIRFTLAGLMR